MASRNEQPEYIKWEVFDEFLKSNMPWFVLNMTQEDGYLMLPRTGTGQRRVLISDLIEWEKLEYLCIMYDKTKIQKIFRRPQFSAEMKALADAVKDIYLRNPYGTTTTGQAMRLTIQVDESKRITSVNMKDILMRPVQSKQERKINFQEKIQPEEFEPQRASVVNRFVLEQNEDLKQKFYSIYSQFEKENK